MARHIVLILYADATQKGVHRCLTRLYLLKKKNNNNKYISDNLSNTCHASRVINRDN